MVPLEFVVPGVPKAHSSKSRDTWQKNVRDCALSLVSALGLLLAEPLTVVIVFFHRDPVGGPDVDNMSKPILDALKGLILEDDRHVVQLIARKTHLHDGYAAIDPSPKLAGGLALSKDFVFVSIKGPPDHARVP